MLYEDEHLLVLDKPANLTVHPTARHHNATVTKILAQRYPGQFLSLIHRLDKETSGVLLVAKTIEAERAWFVEHGRLSAQQSKSVIVAVDKLCAGLRPHAQTLVDAFAIPLAWRETNLMEFLGEAGPDA